MTKRLKAEVAKAFIDNMRWFCNMGRISWTIKGNVWSVTASRYAWSHFHLVSEDYA